MKDGGIVISLIIFREDHSAFTDYPSFFWRYGFYEWLEIRNAIKKSKSKNKEYVEAELNKLFDRVSKIIEIPPLPLKPSRRRKLIPIAEEEAPKKMSMKQRSSEMNFSAQHLTFQC